MVIKSPRFDFNQPLNREFWYEPNMEYMEKYVFSKYSNKNNNFVLVRLLHFYTYRIE